jgi:hypothetical protein
MAKPAGTNTSRFEDLEDWKRASNRSADIYRELKDLKGISFRHQMTRSRLSIPSNIVEGFEKEITLGSNTLSILRKRILRGIADPDPYGTQIGYIKGAKSQAWLKETIEISSMIKALIKKKRRFIKVSF